MKKISLFRYLYGLVISALIGFWIVTAGQIKTLPFNVIIPCLPALAWIFFNILWDIKAVSSQKE